MNLGIKELCDERAVAQFLADHQPPATTLSGGCLTQWNEYNAMCQKYAEPIAEIQQEREAKAEMDSRVNAIVSFGMTIGFFALVIYWIFLLASLPSDGKGHYVPIYYPQFIKIR